MNATTASATTAPTMNAPCTVYIYRHGQRISNVQYHSMDKVRAYMKKNVKDGFQIKSIRLMGTIAIIDIAQNIAPRTPGYQKCMVMDDLLYVRKETPRANMDVCAYTYVKKITATIQYDAPIGPEHIQTTATTATTSETCLNAVEECANICPTAQDAVNIASILDTPIRIITPTHAIEINWTVCRVEIRRNSRYVRGFIELNDVSFDMDKDGLRISYYEKGINHFDNWFIAWGDIQTITALTSKLDIFRSVKGAN